MIIARIIAIVAHRTIGIVANFGFLAGIPKLGWAGIMGHFTTRYPGILGFLSHNPKARVSHNFAVNWPAVPF